MKNYYLLYGHTLNEKIMKSKKILFKSKECYLNQKKLIFFNLKKTIMIFINPGDVRIHFVACSAMYVGKEQTQSKSRVHLVSSRAASLPQITFVVSVSKLKIITCIAAD